MRALSFDFDGDVTAIVRAPSAHRDARETSALAAVEIQPIRGKQNALILQLITQAGDQGLSDEELRQMTGLSRQTICVRRFDLRSLLEPATRRAKSPAGRWMTCWKRRTR